MQSTASSPQKPLLDTSSAHLDLSSSPIRDDSNPKNDAYKKLSGLLFLLLLTPNTIKYHEVMRAAGLSEEQVSALSAFKAGVTTGAAEESIGDGLSRLAESLREISSDETSSLCSGDECSKLVRVIIVEKVLDNNKLLSIARQKSSVASIEEPHAGNMVSQGQQTDLSTFS